MTVWHSLEGQLPVIGLGMMRLLGVFVMLPLFTSRNLGGGMIRNGLVFVLSVPLWPVCQDYAINASFPLSDHLTLYSREIFIGIVIGFVSAIPFWALDAACYIIDTMRGSSMASIFNPQLGETSSVLGFFVSQLSVVTFISFGGFYAMLDVVYRSYTLLPPNELLNFTSYFPSLLSHAWSMLFHLMLAFCLPSIIVMLLIDISLGLLNRSAQQLNVFFLAMPIKSTFSIFFLAIGLYFAFTHFQQKATYLLTLIPSFMQNMN